MKASSFNSCAEQCAELEIGVGDFIVGRETYGPGSWSEAKLQCLWIGESVVVWKVWRRTDEEPNWRYDGEKANWSLDCRDWEKVESEVAA